MEFWENFPFLTKENNIYLKDSLKHYFNIINEFANKIFKEGYYIINLFIIIIT